MYASGIEDICSFIYVTFIYVTFIDVTFIDVTFIYVKMRVTDNLYQCYWYFTELKIHKKSLFLKYEHYLLY